MTYDKQLNFRLSTQQLEDFEKFCEEKEIKLPQFLRDSLKNHKESIETITNLTTKIKNLEKFNKLLIEKLDEKSSLDEIISQKEDEIFKIKEKYENKISEFIRAFDKIKELLDIGIDNDKKKEYIDTYINQIKNLE